MNKDDNREINSILLVDDDNINNFINYQLLKKLRITKSIHCVTSGKDALDFIMEFSGNNDGNCPDLILLDINMPGMSGFEFLEYYNMIYFKNRANVNVVFLTTSSHERDLDRIKNQFKLPFINKPLTEEKLLMVLKDLYTFPLKKTTEIPQETSNEK